MLRFAAGRLGTALAVLLCVSLVAFALIRLGGDPAIAIAGETAQPEEIAAIRHTYGLDQPMVVQYARWVGLACLGDFGTSIHYQRPVGAMIAERLPVTALLAAAAMLLAGLVAIPLGMLAAIRPGSWLDRLALFAAVLGQATPSFWLALVMVVLFGVRLHWLPISGSATWQHFVMPTLALGSYAAPPIMRLTRAGMIEALRADYVRTAWAKGLGPILVFCVHALPNALIPIVALAAVQFGALLAGSVVIESVFNLRGIGWLSYDAMVRADLPVIQAIVLVIAAIYVLLTTMADLANAWLDPRMRSA